MPNRLAQAQSLYLRKHAENPVDWWPWSDAALAAARQSQRPIFLSIGYSSCHWCTVMEGEAFSDPTVADYLNAHYLPIKVDREERPDIDSIYMQALQMMIGQGGWPLNIFLTPAELTPFYGGTYFPVQPKYGRPGFLQILQALHELFHQDPEQVRTVTTQILDGLRRSTLLPESTNLDQGVLSRGFDRSQKSLQPTGAGTRFPMIPYALTALRGCRLEVSEEAHSAERAICRQRGHELALGGIFDHVAGGFHRYTVDATWTVPHFEKMLYDNGQIMEYLAELWSAGEQIPAFERAIALTAQWLTREMTAPDGYFYAAQDADSFVDAYAAEPEEGAFYVWSYSELEELLDAGELEALTADFAIAATGNFEGKIVLQRHHGEALGASTVSALNQLFQTRYGTTAENLSVFPPAQNNQAAKTQHWPGRIPAVTDTKMIVAWNGLMISGLARAAAVFANRLYFDMAVRAARFILENQWMGDRLHRLNYEGRPAVLAQSEDYALLIKALLDLDQAARAINLEAEQSPTWLDQAMKVQAEFDQWVWHEEQGGYTNTAKDVGDSLLIRERTYQDSATPSANGVAMMNLIRLALLTEDLSYLDRAEQGLTVFGSVISQIPQACPTLIAALDWFRHGTLVRTAPKDMPMLMRHYAPSAVYKPAETLPPGTVGLVCEGLFCKAPAKDWETLRSQLRYSQQRGSKSA